MIGLDQDPCLFVSVCFGVRSRCNVAVEADAKEPFRGPREGRREKDSGVQGAASGGRALLHSAVVASPPALSPTTAAAAAAVCCCRFSNTAQ